MLNNLTKETDASNDFIQIEKNDQLADSKVLNIFLLESPIIDNRTTIGIIHLARTKDFPKNQHFLPLINTHVRLCIRG